MPPGPPNPFCQLSFASSKCMILCSRPALIFRNRSTSFIRSAASGITCSASAKIVHSTRSPYRSYAAVEFFQDGRFQEQLGYTSFRALLEEFGFDAAVDHRSPTFAEDLAAAVPDGIDVYFENVGGDVFDAVLPLLNVGARVPVCGFIAHYNDKGVAGPDRLPAVLATLLQKRIRMQGFIILDHYGDRFAAFQREMGEWVASGRVTLHEARVDGLEHAPAALVDLLDGRHLGKLVVQVASA